MSRINEVISKCKELTTKAKKKLEICQMFRFFITINLVTIHNYGLNFT